jgi:NAD(P)-dependent dehydrogenase (short-subunit alcohol dehydrogenase family)
MSMASIRSALETALAGISPAVTIAYENAPFSPVVDVPYQRATLLPAEPDNREIGPGYTERGLFQVDLFYPKDKGPKDALARAALIRSTFAYATELASGGVKVNIIATPQIAPARADGDRFMVPVKIRWHSRIAGG